MRIPLLVTILVIFSVPVSAAQLIWQEDFESGFVAGKKVSEGSGSNPEVSYTGASAVVERDRVCGNNYLYLRAAEDEPALCVVDLEKVTREKRGDFTVDFSFHPLHWIEGHGQGFTYAGEFHFILSDGKNDSWAALWFIFPRVGVNAPGEGCIRYATAAHFNFPVSDSAWNNLIDRWYDVRLIFNFKESPVYSMLIKPQGETVWEPVFLDTPLPRFEIPPPARADLLTSEPFASSIIPAPAGNQYFLREIRFYGFSKVGHNDCYLDDLRIYTGALNYYPDLFGKGLQ